MSKLVPFNHQSGPPAATFANMLDDFFDDSWFSIPIPGKETFRLDVKEDDDFYTIEAELPGVKRKDISVELNDGRLTIGVEAKEIPEEDKKKFIHRERRYTYMERTVYLADAATDGAQATLKHGELTVSVPKDKGLQNARQIEIL